MASYESFARVYDTFMSDTPYDEWCEYLHRLLLRYGVADGLILELGCGTGQMTERLFRLGYDMIGVDNSVDMLEIAREKQAEWENSRIVSGNPDPAASGEGKPEQGILYLLQDMREFELYGTVRAIVSVCDSMNYITEEADLLQVFRLVNNYLDPGGVFLFDLNTLYKYEELLAENVFAENREEGSFIWENWYDPDTRINEYDLTLYIRKEHVSAFCRKKEMAEVCVSDGCGGKILSKSEKYDEAAGSGEMLYERYEEVHYQKAYPIERVKKLLQEAGLHVEAVYDAFSEDEPRPESERVYFVAREQTKKPA